MIGLLPRPVWAGSYSWAALYFIDSNTLYVQERVCYRLITSLWSNPRKLDTDSVDLSIVSSPVLLPVSTLTLAHVGTFFPRVF